MDLAVEFEQFKLQNMMKATPLRNTYMPSVVLSDAHKDSLEVRDKQHT